MSFFGGILARARRRLGRLRLTFGLGPTGGSPVVPPRPGCLHVTVDRTAELTTRIERSATVDIATTRTAELAIRLEKC